MTQQSRLEREAMALFIGFEAVLSTKTGTFRRIPVRRYFLNSFDTSLIMFSSRFKFSSSSSGDAAGMPGGREGRLLPGGLPKAPLEFCAGFSNSGISGTP